MPPRRPKRKLVDVVDTSSTVDGPEAERPLLRGPSKLPRLRQAEKGAGEHHSKDFMQLAEFLRRHMSKQQANSKEYMAAFQKKLEERAEDIRGLLATQEKLLSTHMASVNQVVRTLLDATPNMTVSPNSYGDKETQTLYDASKSVISGARALLDRFQKTNDALRRREIDIPSTAWKEDCENFEKLLALGYDASLTVVEDILQPSSYSPPGQVEKILGETERLAVGMVEESRKAIANSSWGQVADAQVKAFSQLARSIPLATEKNHTSIGPSHVSLNG